MIERGDEDDDGDDTVEGPSPHAGVDDSAVHVDATVATAPKARIQRKQRSTDLIARQRKRTLPSIETAGPPISLTADGRSVAGPAETGSRHAKPSATPAEALRDDEIDRTRVFLKLCIVTVISSLAAITVAGGDPFGKFVVMIGCALVALAAGWMLWMTREPDGYTSRRILVVALVIAAGAHGAIYYWGVASPVVAMVLYGIYFFSFGSHFRVTLSLYVLCVVLHLALAGAIIFGVIADHGIISITHLAFSDQLIIVGVVQFLYLITFLTGRASRKTMLNAVSRLEQAVRSVAQREAMLVEARQELDRALKVEGAGRYTDQVIGSYRLGLLIGRGAMGEVYEATSVDTGAIVAMKLLHATALSDPQQSQRFIREIDVASRVHSPHVVRVLEVGTTGGEIPYFVMERLRGADLAQQLRSVRAMRLNRVVALLDELAVGLEAARNVGIVHRDLKPHNVFLDDSTGVPRWKILDFGVSKLDSHHGTLTQGHVVGTPGYMAPEQARSEEVDHRADVYALAAIAYRALCGQPAFTGKDVPSTLYDVVYKMPTQPSLLVALPTDVDRVLAMGLAKDVADRFTTALEFADAFRAAAGPGISVALRHRADDLITRWPWGTRR